MKINVVMREDDLIVLFDGELDEYTSNYTREYLDKIFEDYGYKSVIFDMTKLKFMDSTGIGVLLGRYKKLKQFSKEVFIHNPNNTIEKIIKMSGIYEIMPKIY